MTPSNLAPLQHSNRSVDIGSLMVVRAAAPQLARPSDLLELERGATHAPRFDFDDVYRDNVRFVWRLLRGMGVSDAAVDDAVQDVFLVVHRRLDEFDGRFSIRTWLFAIANRIASDYRRRYRRASRNEPLSEGLYDPSPSPAQSAERWQSLRLIEDLLDELEDDKRVVLVLADIEGMTAPEMAVIMAVPLNTVYSRLRRARAQFSEALAERQRREK